MGDAEVDMRLGPLLALLDAGVEGLDSAAEIALLQAQETEPEPGIVGVRLLGRELGVQLLGLFLLPLLLEDRAEIVEDFGKVGRDLQAPPHSWPARRRGRPAAA